LTFNDTTWVQYTIDEPSRVVGYAIVSANDAPERDPRDWEFQGWDEEEGRWTTLHSVTNEPQWPYRFQVKEFYFANKSSYKSYRLKINSPHSGSIIQMAELQIFGDITLQLVDITDEMGVVLEPHHDSPVGEAIENIIDNNVYTKYLTFNESTWIEYRHTEPVRATGYAIISANDVPERDPRDWEFQGWDQKNSKWITLHSVIDEPQWHQRFQKKKFSFNSGEMYDRFRLAISSAHGVGIIQMAELEIYKLISTSVQDDQTRIPYDYILDQNYPNPFNPSTRIPFSIPQNVHVRLTIHNMLGQTIKTLVDQIMPAGLHSLDWDGTNESGAKVSNAVYFYRLHSDLGDRTKKMMLLR
ncbi:T9SS type A sorting domain-containing protein, partial [candidate division KSB1 bacterium]|nr:T9SS type A sorting domain-containing protein [candidate division KSB1 bacterium]